MNIGIISDIHLGKRMYRKQIGGINAYEKEVSDKWFSAIDDIVNKRPDILLILGDLFEFPNPTAYALDIANRGLEKLDKANIKTYIIGGNHDFSNKNSHLDVHPFRTLQKYESVEYYDSKEGIVDLDEVVIAFVPHQKINIDDKTMKLNDSNMKKVWININKQIRFIDKPKILASHGLIEEFAFMYTGDNADIEAIKNSNMILPEDFILNFDYVLLGHIHSPFISYKKNNKTKTKNTMIVSPGSLVNPMMQDQSNLHSTGPLYLDLDTSEVKRTEIPSLKVIEKEIKGIEDLVKELENVKGHFYVFNYIGESEDIPHDLYNNALGRAISISIRLIREKDESHTVASMKDFWTWLQEEHPNYFSEFKTVIKEEEK